DHALLYFDNDETADVDPGGADRRGPNLFRRTEVAFPILDGELKARVIDEGLKPYLADNHDAWELASDGSYHRLTPKGRAHALAAQQELLHRLADTAGARLLTGKSRPWI